MCLKENDGAIAGVLLATQYCKECDEQLCDKCSRRCLKKKNVHQVMNLGPDLELELVKPRGNNCDIHSGKQLGLYCFDCKTNICMVCHAVQHQQHKCREIDKAAQEFIKQIDADLSSIVSRTTALHQRCSQLEKQQNKFLANIKQCEVAVKGKGEEIKKLIDRRVSDLLQELQSVKSKTLKEIQTCREKISLALVAMESFKRYAEELKVKGRPCDISRAANDLHTRAGELLKKYVTSDDYRTSDVIFKPMNMADLTAAMSRIDKELVGVVQGNF